MNQITHFHDANNVYGSDEEDAGQPRGFLEGLMGPLPTKLSC